MQRLSINTDLRLLNRISTIMHVDYYNGDLIHRDLQLEHRLIKKI